MNPESRTVKRVVPFLLTALVACAPAAAPTAAPAPAPTPAAAAAPSAADAAFRHREIHWVRTAAEYRALTEQVYRQASEVVREKARGREAGSWAVILDADETVLDNSEYQRRIAERGEDYDPRTWAGWVREEAAGVVPGADRFIRLVQSLGGRVALVTNRSDALCPATVRNLDALGIEAAVVLCETETSQKEERFRMVEEGTTDAGLPPLDVVMWVGDNVGDFPDLEQALRDAPAEAFGLFGERYFVLPNPMYGSWMANDWR